MTKLLKIITLLLAVFVLFSCGSKVSKANTENNNIITANYIIEDDSLKAFNIAANNNILIVYFTWSGNSRTLAGYAREITGGDIFEIVPVQPYPTQYRATTEQAREEQNNNYLPEIRNKVNNLASYDVIILCYPNWWGTIPQIVKRFLSENDFSGKTIAPICAHAGSRMGRSLTDIRNLCPNSTITEGLDIRSGSVGNARNNIRDWINRIGINN